MLITISNVLDDGHRALLDGLISELTWADGAQTAGSIAKQVKRNKQADLTSKTGIKVDAVLRRAVQTNPVLRAAAQPRTLSQLLISKTEAGGFYGRHVDNAFMKKDHDTLRSDLSFTLFLSDPTSYQGGELVIEHAGMTQSVKGAAGDLVLYPSGSLHQVSPVTSGERVVCVGWIESQIKDASDRETLFDLINTKSSLADVLDAQSLEMLTLSKVIANLLRRFS